MLIFVVTTLVIIIDQVSKNLVRNNLDLGDTVPLIQDVFHITHVQNTGAAFSMLEGKYLITIGVPIILIIFCIVFIRNNMENMHITLKLAMPLILGGGIGNLYDRIMYGFVTDMFDFRLISFAVFNVADIAVCIGCALLVVFVVFFDDSEGGKNAKN
ncbi:MAG: signal peptidase II [Peptostreptococcaceae bacterium]|nr:signal peptidase II [Peptostreptococcaceae bacterium]